MRVLIITLLIVFSHATYSQMLQRTYPVHNGMISNIHDGYYGSENPVAFRGNMTFASQVFYDDKRKTTIIVSAGDASFSYGAAVYEIEHATENYRLSEFIPSSIEPNTDNHKIACVLVEDDSTIVYRVEVHFSPLEIFYGEPGGLVDKGNFSNLLTYPNAFILNDTIGIIARIRDTRTQDRLYSVDGGRTFVYDRPLTGTFPSGTQPYPSVFSDWIDGSIVYYISNQRSYDGTYINYWKLSVYKATHFESATNIAETVTDNFPITYTEMNNDFTIDLVDDDIHEARIMGGYVDESDDLHAVYINTEIDSIYFIRTQGSSLERYTIPIDCEFVPPGDEVLPGNVTQINDFAELVHRGGDRYDLFTWNFQGPLKKYSTEDAFFSVTGPETISPPGVEVRSMMGTRNYRPGKGWPYVIAYSYEDPTILGKQFLGSYQYYPK